MELCGFAILGREWTSGHHKESKTDLASVGNLFMKDGVSYWGLETDFRGDANPPGHGHEF